MKKITDKQKKALVLSSLLLGGVILAGCPSPVDEPEPEPTPVVKPGDEKPGDNPVIDGPVNPNPGGEVKPGDDPSEDPDPNTDEDPKPTTPTPTTPTPTSTPLLLPGDTKGNPMVIYINGLGMKLDGIVDVYSKYTDYTTAKSNAEMYKGIRYAGKYIRFRFVPNSYNKADVGNYLDALEKIKNAIGKDANGEDYVTADYSAANWSEITLMGDVSIDQLKEFFKDGILRGRDIDTVLDDTNFTADNLPKLGAFMVRASNPANGKENLYGKDVEKITKLYYSKGAVSRYNTIFDAEDFEFDGKPYLESGNGYMYDENNKFTGAYDLDIGFVLLNQNLTFKNVNVVDKTKSGSTYGKTFLPPLVNVRFEADVSYVTRATAGASGVVEFANLPPHETPRTRGKVIIKKTDSYNVGIKDLNVLELGSEVDTLSRITSPNDGFAQDISVGEVYYDGSKVGSIGFSPKAIYSRSEPGKGEWHAEKENAGYTPVGKSNCYLEEKGNASQPISMNTTTQTKSVLKKLLEDNQKVHA